MVSFKIYSRSFPFPLGIIALLFFVFAFVPGVVKAQATSIELTPFLFEFRAERGETIEKSVTIKNVGKETMDLGVDLRSAVIEPNGTLNFNNIVDILPATELAPWMNITAQLPSRLQPGEKLDVPFKIKIPENAESGTHIGGIVFTVTTKTLDGVKIQGEAVATIQVTTGNSFEKGEVSSFEYFVEGDKIRTVLSFYNSGNATIKPKGAIVFRNTFGKEVARDFINPDALSVLPGQSRNFVSMFPLPKYFSKYTWSTELTYGAKRLKLPYATSVWLGSKTKTIAGLAGVLGTITLAVYLVRRYNRWLIRRFQKTNF